MPLSRRSSHGVRSLLANPQKTPDREFSTWARREETYGLSVIQTEVAVLRLQQMSKNAKASPELRSQSEQIITDRNTKSVIDPLVRALFKHDPGASKVVRSVAVAQDRYQGVHTNNPDDWPIMVKTHR
jgi:hypothetical protein